MMEILKTSSPMFIPEKILTENHRMLSYRQTANWLRWCDDAGQVILSGSECAEQEYQRAEQEHQRAEQEHQRAEQLAAQLRALGVEPHSGI